MTLQQAKYLMSIVELGSITKASKELYTAQSGLSLALKDIEEEYGITIFHRTPKGVELTLQGQEFAVDVQKMLDQYDYINQKYKYPISEENRICISSQHHIYGESAFLSLVSAMDDKRFRFGYLEGRTDQVIDQVEIGISNIGFLFYCINMENMFNQELRNRQLCFHQISQGNLYAYFHRNHPLSTKTSLSMEDLVDYPFISYDSASPRPQSGVFTSLSRRAPKGMQNFYITDRASAYAIMNGTTAYLTGTGYIPEDMFNNDIISVPIYDEEAVKVGWIVKKEQPLSKIANKYINLVKEMYCE